MILILDYSSGTAGSMKTFKYIYLNLSLKKGLVKNARSVVYKTRIQFNRNCLILDVKGLLDVATETLTVTITATTFTPSSTQTSVTITYITANKKAV